MSLLSYLGEKATNYNENYEKKYGLINRVVDARTPRDVYDAREEARQKRIKEKYKDPHEYERKFGFADRIINSPTPFLNPIISQEYELDVYDDLEKK